MRAEADGRRTLLYDDDGLHVATIWEVAGTKEAKASGHGSGLFNWYTRNNGGRASSEEEALAKIREELER